jgi:histidine triad (HIT) family protein
MALTPQQIKILKEQLLSQIENLPENTKAEAKRQIETLSPQALELMLKQQEKKQERIFRLIVKGEIPSTKIEENEDAIAVLEINPISRGHMIIIPKKPAKSSKDIPEQAFTLAKRLSEALTEKLKAASTEIQTENKFGEAILNIIPVYDKQLNINSPRKKAKKEELEEIARKLLEEKPKIELIKIKKENKTSQPLKLKRKIP